MIDEVEAAGTGYAELAIWDEVGCEIGGIDCGDERGCQASEGCSDANGPEFVEVIWVFV